MTPVPGGVGPLTITMLMMNTLRAALARVGVRDAARRVDRRHRHRQEPRARAVREARRADDRRRHAGARRGCGRARRASPRSSNASAATCSRRRATLDRHKLASIVFMDPAARRDLEAIIHPAVQRATDAWFDSLDPARYTVAIADIPLLYEVGRDRDFDAVIVTAVDPETQVRRVIERDGASEAEARQRLAAQLPIDEKVTTRGLRHPDRRHVRADATSRCAACSSSSRPMLRVGIDLGGTKIEGIALDGSREVARLRVDTPRGDYAATLDAIAAVVDDARAARRIAAARSASASRGRCRPRPASSRTPIPIWLIGKPLLEDLRAAAGTRRAHRQRRELLCHLRGGRRRRRGRRCRLRRHRRHRHGRRDRGTRAGPDRAATRSPASGATTRCPGRTTTSGRGRRVTAGAAAASRRFSPARA